ncbi:MAG: hypothetical protein A3B23_00185 [Candidatus Colwellbacteria bacterium RIFCSPLOWO2_01_FULL_48_10]|uniref:GIY-YIG domain-containing protein n=1 Tax=Candidatus Colwellbacteria bacterium RIFCSPLOWO2_01_FULL_48_10 TaxID=1797690 RepID=A0A1G1Z7A1_9BACT|nr:MAG: hypothetical protein A3B23_00185 [Candidatus Colwellbacteria bacterium RIFCSPLOWO2_01_FULL_48_10]
MFYFYLLKNKFKNIYIGYTADLRQRIKDHNYGKVDVTKDKKPWQIFYYEAYLSEDDARLRESTLKNYGSILGQLKKRISKSLGYSL